MSYSYDDTHFTVTSTVSIDSSKSVKQITSVDGLGRPNLTTTEDASSNVYSKVSAQYDLVGRAYQTSNPYTSASPSYWTITALDVLGRPTSVALPDNSATTYSYTTNTTTATDPTGKQRESVVDSAGRLAAIWEPDPTNNNYLTLQTSYAYNVLDELTQITQGSQTRSYVYDALGRLSNATTPESGTVCYGTVSGGICQANGYDPFDNLLTRTDARGVVTSYGYDGLNRLTSISYNVSGASGVPATASVNLTYGTNAAQFNNGRLITMSDGVGSESYTYNSLGEMTQLHKVISATTYTTSYGFNLAGELTQITYPSGRVVQQSVDPIGRLCEIAPSSPTGCGSAASPYATGYGYSTASQLTGFKYGNGIYASFGFSPDRLQLTCLDYSTTNRNGSCTHDSTTKFGLTYAYGSAGSNNGQIMGITDNSGTQEAGRSVTYTYDALYRLSTAVTTGSTNYPQWGLSESYDRYSNRAAQSVTAGTGPSNSVSVDATTNHINTSGYAYDTSGNMTSDGYNTLVYDAENRTTSATNGGSAGAYVYDGNSLRVEKCIPNCSNPTSYTVYIFSGSKVIAEYDNGAAVGSPSREYIYAGGTLLAKVDSSGTEYYHQDQLSNRLVTDSSGNTLAQMGHYPYGESWYNTTNDKLLFTTYERDAESGNDYAMMRSYVSRLARMSSPDLLSGSMANPQSLNRYAYVANDPANSMDPSGLCGSPVAQDSGSGTSEGSGSGGPSATDFAGDLADPDPQFETWDCYWSPSGGGGSLWLDGTDITAYGGDPGFPIGGPGAIGDPIGNSGIVLSSSTGDEGDASSDIYFFGSSFFPWQDQPGGGFFGGPMDVTELRANALVALLNPNCANLFGGFKNAVASLFNSSYNRYVPGQGNPFLGQISNYSWNTLVAGFAHPGVQAQTLEYSGKPGGTIFFAGTFNLFAPGFATAPGDVTQMTIFLHEQEHAANHDPLLDRTIDASPASYKADAEKIDQNCNKPQIPTQSSPITGGLTPP